MGMTGCFYALGDDDLQAILNQPSRIQGLWADELMSPPPGLGPSFLARWFGFGNAAKKTAIDPWRPGEKADVCDVDKAWHGIHFLLTGTSWEGEGPLAFMLQGGREIEFEMGYGSPHAFFSDEVRQIAAALAELDLEALYDQANPAEFAKEDIYPMIWDEPKEDCIGYLIEYLRELQTFVQKAADSHQALIAALT